MYSIKIIQCAYSSQCSVCSISRIIIWNNVLQSGQHNHYLPTIHKKRRKRSILDKMVQRKGSIWVTVVSGFDKAGLQLEIFTYVFLYSGACGYRHLANLLRRCMPSCCLDCAIWEAVCAQLISSPLPLRSGGDVCKETRGARGGGSWYCTDLLNFYLPAPVIVDTIWEDTGRPCWLPLLPL